MNNQTSQSKENLQDMLTRVMTIARLLIPERALPDDLSKRHEERKKHKHENL
jgi:hypothetical protein